MNAPSTSHQRRTTVSTLLGWAVLLLLPWLLGGQWLPFQIGAAAVAVTALVISLRKGISHTRVPMILLAGLCGYALIQFANPAFSQSWQTGLRVWTLVQEDYIQWLPSSIQSGFTDASPLRFLILILTAAGAGLAIFNQQGRKTLPFTLILIAVSGSAISLVGIIQANLGSQSILGVFDAKGRGLGLFFGTFLYKNQAS